MNPFLVLRTQKGLTRRQWALMLGTGVSQVQAIEAGLPRRPYRPVLRALEKILGTHAVVGLESEYERWRTAQAEEATHLFRQG